VAPDTAFSVRFHELSSPSFIPAGEPETHKKRRQPPSHFRYRTKAPIKLTAPSNLT